MVSADNLRSLFDRKIFDDFGISATWKQKTSSSNWGDTDQPQYGSGTSITVVPYDTLSTVMSMERFGQLESGDTSIAIRYDKDIAQDDLIEFDGKAYEVHEVEDNFLEKNLIKIVKAVRVD